MTVINQYNELLKINEALLSLKVLQITLDDKIKNLPEYKELQEVNKQILTLNQIKEDNKATIKQIMLSTGVKTFEQDNVKFTLKKSPGSIEIESEEGLPEKYIKEKITKVVDKKLIKEDIENGYGVPGADIVYTYSLIITDKNDKTL